MSTEYQYTQSDFSISDIDLYDLQTIIENDAGIITGVSNINRTIDGANFTIFINFVDSLNPSELLSLDNIVANYTNNSTTNDQYFIVCDRKPVGTNGGTFVSNIWETREINYLDGSNEYISLTDNQFTLQSGRYAINIKVPACGVGSHQSRLYNISDSTYIYGTNADASKDLMTCSEIATFLFLNSTSTFSIEHQCSKTMNNIGKGRATGFDADEIYTFISIQRLL